jgi:hypothetical protein
VKDRLRLRPLWDVLATMVDAMKMCFGKWDARKDASAQHRPLFMRGRLPPVRNAYLPFIYLSFSQLLGLPPQLHDRVWRQYAGVQEGTMVVIDRQAVERVARLQTQREFVVERTVPVAGHKQTVVVVDVSTPSSLSFECTCMHYNSRIICAHIFTVIDSHFPAPIVVDFDQKQCAVELIKTLGRTRWVGECAEASASLLLTDGALAAVAIAQSATR